MTSVQPRLEIQRTIHAPVDRVFKAWTDPELLARWLAPGEPAKVIESAVDLKVGGAYRIRMVGVMNGISYDVVAAGTYIKIVPNESLSFTWTFLDESRRSSVGDSVVTVILRPSPAGTELTLIHEKLATSEARSGHEWGWINCMEKLDTVIGKERSP